MISVSLSDKWHVIRNDVFLFPKGVTFEMYRFVINDNRIISGFYNTIIYVVAGTTISLSVTIAGAYALSKQHMLFRKFFTKLLIVAMLFHGGMIPTFLVVRSLGLLNTRWAVIIPNALSIWLLFIMLSYFKTVPTEVEDSARIDGVGDIGILWYIVIPISKAAIATIGLFYAVEIWNRYVQPMIYLSDAKMYPITIVLVNMVLASEHMANSGELGESGFIVSDSLKYATIIVSMLPIVCVYPFIQKYFVKGVMIGSIKA
jgi:putative aldouronate transport system permease protein